MNTSPVAHGSTLAESQAILVVADAPAAPPSAGQAFLTQLPLLAAIVGIFYFLVIRPQSQERKRHEELVAGLKRDDEVLTQAGLFGRVAQVQGGRVELEIAPKVRVWIEAASVKRKAEPGELNRGEAT